MYDKEYKLCKHSLAMRAEMKALIIRFILCAGNRCF